MLPSRGMIPRIRAWPFLVLALVGCHGDTGAADMAACVPHAYACGPTTCPADEFCFFEQFGACAPADLAQPIDDGGAGGGGGGFHPCGQYSCAKLPSSCDCNQLCGSNGQPGSTGCLHSVPACQYATGCRFDGATVTCIDQ